MFRGLRRVRRFVKVRLTIPIGRRSIFEQARLDFENKNGTMFVLCSREDSMVRAVVEEAAALASLALFVGMIAIWAQFIAAL